MNESGFPVPLGEVIDTISEIFHHQGRTEVVELLHSAHARFDETNYDRWDGGTYTWALRLEVPVPIFASLESRLAEIEQAIGTKLTYIERNYPNHSIGEVTITPISSRSPLLGIRMAPSDVEARRLWPEGRFRLFLSHLSADKVAVSRLKSALETFGISAFVAHEDIEPSLEWRDEIELGLKSMHALAALITPEFHGSNWTDQEIGWALGRGVIVIAVKLGQDPYGLAGKYQAISGSFSDPDSLAKAIVNSLLANAQSHSQMRRALVKAFCESKSFPNTQKLKNSILRVKDFTDAEKSLLENACKSNIKIAEAYWVPEAIYKLIGKSIEPESVASTEEEVPF